MDEVRRAALHALAFLDTPPEAHFDAVWRLASDLVGLPFAAIVLADRDRHWFKVVCGSEEQAVARLRPFCARALLADEILVIEDALADERVRDDPIVRSGGTPRSYVGVPLALAPGFALGVLCVWSEEPQSVGPEQRRRLADLAAIVVAHLRLHESSIAHARELARRRESEALARGQAEALAEREAALGETNRLLRLAEQIAQVGHWHVDVRTGRRTWSDEVFRIYGLEPRPVAPPAAEILALYHPDDRGRVEATIRTARRRGETYTFEARLLREGGEIRTVLVRGNCDLGADDRFVAAFGTVMDVTASARAELCLRETADLLKTTLDTMDQGLVMIDAEGTVAVANRRAAELLGLDPDFLATKPNFQEFRRRQAEAGEHDETDPAIRAWIAQGDIQAPLPVYERSRPDGTVLEVRSVALPGGGAVRTYTDITARRQAEADLRRKTALLDATLEHMDQGLLVVDPEGVVRLCSERARRLLDLPAAMMESNPTFCEVRDYQVARGDFARTSDVLRKDLTSGDTEKTARTYERERPDGTVLEIRTVPLPDGSAVRTYTDITGRRQAEAALADSEAWLRALADALPHMVWVYGDGGEATYTNQRLRDYYGDAPLRRMSDRIASHHPEDRERITRAGARTRRTMRACELEGRVRRHDGVYRWHRLTCSPIPRKDGTTEWLSTALDIDEMVEAREALRASEERLALAMDAGSDGLWDSDLVTGEKWTSDRWQTMLGYAPGELRANRLDWSRLVHPDDRDRAVALYAAHLEGRSPSYECEHRLRRKDGGWGWVLARGKVVRRDAEGKPLRVVGTHVDIHARKVAEGRIAHMARHDALTDLPNRTLFRERLEQTLAEIERHGGACAVLCLDLDRFKAVNDTLGHPAGDALLCEIARRLRATLRTEDMVARLGGDEFAILQVADGEPHGTGALAQRLLEAVSRTIVIDGTVVTVDASIGIALAPAQGLDADIVFKRADLALYRAKAEGRNAFRFFAPAMDAAVEERERLGLDLRLALQRGEFVLHYQPVVDIATGRVVGQEALVRWRHPARGLVPPGAFIPLAEETGLIAPLGEWVLRTAARDARRFPSGVRIAVNVSASQFCDADFPALVDSALKAAGVGGERLALEVTESVLIDETDHVRSQLHALRAMGLHIALDDFGTGYSSLSYLRRFPFDTIKVDRAFVADIADPETAAIVRAIVALARGLGMSIIGEGVETAEQLEALRREGCAEVQGYLIGRPVPLAEALAGLPSLPVPGAGAPPPEDATRVA